MKMSSLKPPNWHQDLFEPAGSKLPEALAKLDYDGYRDIRFRKDQALLGAPFKMEMFHPGFLFTRPVRISVVKNGAVEQVPYAAGMFDYGKNRFDPPLPRDLGFAGFRIHYPLNRPGVDDELIVFLGSSYFRFLGVASITDFQREASPSGPAS